MSNIDNSWNLVGFKDFATYLGFATGPGKGDSSWDNACRKYVQRVWLWSAQKQGLHISIYAYNILAISVLSFLAQLEQPPKKVLGAELMMLRKAASGPGNWVSAEDLWYLNEGYGQYKSAVSLAMLSKAAQLRVVFSEKWSEYGASLRTRARKLELLIKETDKVGRKFRWRSWYSRSFIITLQNNRLQLAEKGISFSKIETELCGHELGQKRIERTKKFFQKTAYQMIQRLRLPNFEYRIRDRTRRWNLEGIEARIGAKIHRRLYFLPSLVAPRVASAVFSTLWNRWCTPRRFQRRHVKENVCLLGCGGLAEDSIEHYARCRCIRRVADSYLALRGVLEVNIDHFMLTADALEDSHIYTCVATLVYAAYTATNTIRAEGAIPLAADGTFEMVKQCCRNGVMGHSSSCKILDGR